MDQDSEALNSMLIRCIIVILLYNLKSRKEWKLIYYNSIINSNLALKILRHYCCYWPRST